MKTLDDGDLISKCCEGDREACQCLFNKYKKTVRRTVRRFGFADEEAKDLFQDTWLKIFRSLHRYTEKGSFSSWCAIIAHNTCLSHCRRNGRCALATDPAVLDRWGTSCDAHDRSAWIRDGFELLVREEILETLSHCLERNMDTVPEKRDAMLLILAGYSAKEIQTLLFNGHSPVKENTIHAWKHRFFSKILDCLRSNYPELMSDFLPRPKGQKDAK